MIYLYPWASTHSTPAPPSPQLRVAMDMVEKSSAALMISHGAAHPLYREAAIWLKDLKETAADADDGVLL